MGHIRSFFKQETVLFIAAVCAIATMGFVPPDSGYFAYIDLRVLCLLLCLMAVVSGFQRCGAFQWLAVQLLRHSRNGRILSMALVLLPFFSSMLITNDVALLTFVPFTLLFLEQIRCTHAVIPVLVLQTIAANLGSMATPIGNPQNLFLYEAYHLSVGAFFSAVFPLVAVSLLLLMGASVPLLPKNLPEIPLKQETLRHPRALAVYGILFVLCLLTVLRVVHYGITTLLVLAVIAGMDRKSLRSLDFPLLATFVCFFIVSGNLGRVEAVRAFLQTLLARNTLLTAAAASQVISNVPAAVLLCEFTNQWQPLLEGVNIGGLGTPIASLASLITLKLYLRQPQARPGSFLLVFTLANGVGLLVLLMVSVLL